MDDLCERMYGCDLNRRAIESLIKCGSLDSFGHNRRELLRGHSLWSKSIDDRYKNNLEGQLNLSDTPELTDAKTQLYSAAPGGVSAGAEAGDGKGGHWLYVSGHPLAQYRQVAQQPHCRWSWRSFKSDSDEPIHMSAGKYQDGRHVKVLYRYKKRPACSNSVAIWRL